MSEELTRMLEAMKEEHDKKQKQKKSAPKLKPKPQKKSTKKTTKKVNVETLSPDYQLKFGEIALTNEQAQALLDKMYHIESFEYQIPQPNVKILDIIFKSLKHALDNDEIESENWRVIFKKFLDAKKGFIDPITYLEWLKLYFNIYNLSTSEKENVELIANATDQQLNNLDRFLQKFNVTHFYIEIKESEVLPLGTTRTLLSLLRKGMLTNLRFYTREDLQLILNPKPNYSYKFKSHFSQNFESIVATYIDLFDTIYRLDAKIPDIDESGLLSEIKKSLYDEISHSSLPKKQTQKQTRGSIDKIEKSDDDVEDESDDDVEDESDDDVEDESDDDVEDESDDDVEDESDGYYDDLADLPEV